MAGEHIAYVTYLRDMIPHPKLENGVKVELEGYPEYLNIKAPNGSTFLSIPWENISNVHREIKNKEGVSLLLKSLADLLMIGSVSSWGDPYHHGVLIIFDDTELSREQRLFFKSGGKRKAEWIVEDLWKRINAYDTRMGRVGRPRR